MEKSTDKILNQFNEMLVEETIQHNHLHDSELLSKYKEILDIMSNDYDNYKKVFPYFLATLEDNNETSAVYSINIFLSLFDKFTSVQNIEKFDSSILKTEYTDDTSTILQKALKEGIQKNSNFRITELNLLVNNLSEDDLKKIVVFIIDYLQEIQKLLEWSEDILQRLAIYIAALKSILNTLRNPHIFYFSIGMFLDGLNTSELFQNARDFAEELIYSSFKDDLPELGFFNSYKCYSHQSSFHVAMLYANLSMNSAIEANNSINDKHLSEMILISVRFFRNIKLYEIAIQVYENYTSHDLFFDYNKRALDNSYFNCLMAMQDNGLPNMLYNYLNRNRENILKSGTKEFIPWVLLLYNIRRIYPDADFSSTGFRDYLRIFESSIPKEFIEKHKAIIDGNSSKLKDYLKKSINGLNNTRDEQDLAYDNSTAIVMASRLLEDAFKRKDEEAILLSMLVKSDYSLVFNSRECDGLVQFPIPSDDSSSIIQSYEDKNGIKKQLSINADYQFIWLAISEGKVFQLSYFSNSFQFEYLKSGEWNKFNELNQSGYFSKISFSETVKDNFGLRNTSLEEYNDQTNRIKDDIDFSRLVTEDKAGALLVIKDMDLAEFPHNLFLNQDGSFVHLKKPIANILSTEWYLLQNENTINEGFTKSIWIPTEGGDLTINKLYDSLKVILTEYHFSVVQDSKISSPISADINIICSHGSNTIAKSQVIYPNSANPIINLNQVIGHGEVLVFFVCHSGSYKNEVFRNNIVSLVKSFIKLGYRAIIAPFWALHVGIPSVWLPKFLDDLDQGETIINAVHQANMTVREIYPTPAAWACMHLYGNPNLTIHNN